MKKHFILLFLLLAIAVGRSQSQDLANLANGTLINFKILYEKNDKLFGYFALYTTGKLEEGKKNFEYIILDKNLNKVANNEFEAESVVETYDAYINMHSKIVLTPSIDAGDKSYKSKHFIYPSSKIIDIKKNKIEKEEKFCYENGAVMHCSNSKSLSDKKKDNEIELKEKGYIYESVVKEIKQGGFIILDYQDHKEYANNNNITRFNENKKKLWTYSYNQDGNKKSYESLNVIDIDDKNMYCILEKTESRTKYSFSLIVLDLATGKIVANSPLNNDLDKRTIQNITTFYSLFPTYRVNNSKSFDNDKIVLVGKYFSNKFMNAHDYDFNGYIRLLIDKKTFEVRTDVIDFATDLKKYFPEIDRIGTLKNRYSLEIRDFFFMKDGSTGILTEKIKVGDGNNTSDMVYLNTDKDFKLQGIKAFEKEKDKRYTINDYLFSQYCNDDKDFVFFYKDEGKDKKTSLFINTIIKGKFNQEQITISSENIKITPYVAKEGYILLRENNENKKYNQIRLEKLNY